MTPHIEAEPGDYADIVLMPGDPLRARWIAETYLQDVKCVNSVRNCLGYTGTHKGIPLSVQAGGMGQASNAIYITELYKDYDVGTIIRVGSAGGISQSVRVGDIVAAITACTDSNMTSGIIPGFQYSPAVTYSLLKNFMDTCPQSHVGVITSNDYFYQPDPEWWKSHQSMGVLAVEMETHILYTLAAKYGRSALTVCTISDHLQYGNAMTSKQRETSFHEMMEAVLESITG